MKISILTLFPEMFTGPFDASIIKRAKEKGIVDITLVNIRNFATDKYGSVDERPYGGGVGMILRVDVVDKALRSVIPDPRSGRGQALIGNPSAGYSTRIMDPRQSLPRALTRGGDDNFRTILLDPQGTPYTQAMARNLSKLDHLILICGHYEGVDERIRNLVDEEISLGDFILTGGEIPAMAIADSIVRLLPGTLSKPEATIKESFSEEGGLEYPQYTRPEVYQNMKVPDILLSGDHKEIEQWRKNQARKRTKSRRPDLLR